MVNSRTFKNLCNEIKGLSSTCPLFKYFQGPEFRRKKLKYFQGLSRMRENPVFYLLHQLSVCRQHDCIKAADLLMAMYAISLRCLSFTRDSPIP